VRRTLGGSGVGALALILISASPGSAQSPQGQQAQRPAVDTAGVQLVYEREVFAYSDRGRRDPFRPLTSSDETGPRFEELVLQGVIYSTGQGRSVALIADAGGRIHRVRTGDVVGNSRVVEIGPLRVVLAVENFGTIRQEMLELRKRGGADR
jgi:Tfp pilus assembly protein PilP